jgi:tRNA 2-thiouridine synthesizing protein A
MTHDGQRILVPLPSPHAVVDAGGEEARPLMAELERCMTGLAAGQILEIVSVAPGARMDVVAWCHVTGHHLIQFLGNADQTRFWIQKR